MADALIAAEQAAIDRIQFDLYWSDFDALQDVVYDGVDLATLFSRCQEGGEQHAVDESAD